MEAKPEMGFEPTTLRVLTSELLCMWTRWRARVIFVGWTCEPHLAVAQSITSKIFSVSSQKKSLKVDTLHLPSVSFLSSCSLFNRPRYVPKRILDGSNFLP